MDCELLVWFIAILDDAMGVLKQVETEGHLAMAASRGQWSVNVELTEINYEITQRIEYRLQELCWTTDQLC